MFSKEDKMQQKQDNEIFCAQYDALFAYVLSLCRDQKEAEDITQETFFKAIAAKHTFQGNSSLYTWLCAIAKNIWLGRLRKNKDRQVGLDENMPEQKGVSFEERLEDEQQALAIHNILHGLSEPYKEVFSLRVFGQLSFAKIAHVFGKTESWARVTYHRARKMIVETMRKEGLL